MTASKDVVFLNSKPKGFQVQASLKEKAVPGLTAAGLTASTVLPELAEALAPAFFPSLNSFLLSIAGASIVLGTIVGALIGVSNFNPVECA